MRPKSLAKCFGQLRVGLTLGNELGKHPAVLAAIEVQHGERMPPKIFSPIPYLAARPHDL